MSAKIKLRAREVMTIRRQDAALRVKMGGPGLRGLPGAPGVGAGGLGLPSPGAANQMPYYTGANTIALTALTAFMRTLLDDTTAAAARATLGIGTVPSAYFLGNIVNNAAVTIGITQTPRLLLGLAANTQTRGGGGIIWGNSAGSPNLNMVAQSYPGAGAQIVTVNGAGTLDGTTGPAGSLNVRTGTGTLSVENRTGGTGTYGVVIFEGL